MRKSSLTMSKDKRKKKTTVLFYSCAWLSAMASCYCEAARKQSAQLTPSNVLICWMVKLLFWASDDLILCADLSCGKTTLCLIGEVFATSSLIISATTVFVWCILCRSWIYQNLISFSVFSVFEFPPHSAACIVVILYNWSLSTNYVFLQHRELLVNSGSDNLYSEFSLVTFQPIILQPTEHFLKWLFS